MNYSAPMGTIIPSVFFALVVAACLTSVANVCTTVYLHRALSHRALQLKPVAAVVFRATIWLTTGIKPRQWVAVHRKHHAFTDVEGDPHSPVILGWKAVQLKNVALYRRALADPDTVTRYAKDLPEDTLDRLLFRHTKVGLTLGIVTLVVVLGPWTGLLAAFLHANMYLAGSAAVNALGHRFGRRPYQNQATNLQWLAFCTMGEGLHNNHHAAPSSARLSHNRRQIDPGWWVIRSLMSLRLATLRFEGIKLMPNSLVS